LRFSGVGWAVAGHNQTRAGVCLKFASNCRKNRVELQPMPIEDVESIANIQSKMRASDSSVAVEQAVYHPTEACSTVLSRGQRSTVDSMALS
jgi:hypothetical protein